MNQTVFNPKLSLSRLVLQGHRRLLVAGVVASVINALTTLALIAFINQLMAERLTTPLSSGLTLLALLAVILGTHVLSGVWIARRGALTMVRLRRRLANAVSMTPYPQLETVGAHRIYAAFAEDLPKLAVAFATLPMVLMNSVVAIVGMVYLGWVSWIHLGVILGFLLLGMVFSEWVLMPKVKLYAARFRQSMNGLYEQIQALVYGSKELKLNRLRERFFRDEQFEHHLQEIYHHSVRRDYFSTAYTGWSASLSLFLLGGVLWVSQYWLPMTQQQLLTFALMLMYLRGPVISIINNVPNFAAARISLSNLIELDLAKEECHVGRDMPIIEAERSLRSLELDLVRYRYGNSSGDDAYQFAMGPLSLKIRQGEVIYLTGGNGSGKSTLAKLLVGLYRPSEGTIKLAGEEITADRMDWYRSHFSAIFGDYYLFKQVLNGMGVLADDAAVRDEIERLDLGHKVDVTQGVLSNTDLSQGQRKRLALVVALAEDRPILLFDEWAAEQDPDFRRRFYHEIIPALKSSGKTIIAITHDDHYFHTADRVLCMDQGLLIEKLPTQRREVNEKSENQ
ncbi:MAG: cyclic peptide export ABC transporter [Xanthomonadaceae bacterium]|nr:cyclic peptide export ABC transporter [Xanthomonadaceae bacterium]